MKFSTMEQFINMNMSVIDNTASEIMRGKSGEQTLTKDDMIVITERLKNIYRSVINGVPQEIELACGFAEAILAPSAIERIKRIKTLKNILGIAGGSAGIGMIITGVGGILGWGAGVVASITAFFVGTSIAGPVGWIAGGVGVAAIAGYFALKRNDPELSRKAIDLLKIGVKNPMPSIWVEYETKIKEYEFDTSNK
jgi:hypothetical protein